MSSLWLLPILATWQYLQSSWWAAFLFFNLFEICHFICFGFAGFYQYFSFQPLVICCPADFPLPEAQCLYIQTLARPWWIGTAYYKDGAFSRVLCEWLAFIKEGRQSCSDAGVLLQNFQCWCRFIAGHILK